jgi:hypothetical protein
MLFAIRFDLFPQGLSIHSEIFIGEDPTDTIGSNSDHVGSFMNPGVSFSGTIHAQSFGLISMQTDLTRIPR